MALGFTKRSSANPLNVTLLNIKSAISITKNSTESKESMKNDTSPPPGRLITDIKEASN